jgi:hypothetical protein
MKPLITMEAIEPRIYFLRGQKVMLDADLSQLYGVSTKRLNEQVRRNLKRFPEDFIFQLTKEESESLRSQNATLKTQGRGRHSKYMPRAFTEHGAIMAATILNSPRAVHMSVFVVRAFVRMRAALGGSGDLGKKLAAMETELKERLNLHETVIVDVLRRMMEILDPPPLPEPKRRRIGFGSPESPAE